MLALWTGLLFFSYATIATPATTDILTISDRLHDGETLVSANGTFALGFFSPTNSSSRRYIAIWYHNIPSNDVVWVANPRGPVPDLSGTLSLSSNGSLLLQHGLNSTLIWSSTPAPSSSALPTAQLLDSGNFVVKSFDNVTLWQSFDYPSNTILAGMFIGWDLRRGINHNLTAWTTPTDPTPGPYTTAIHLDGVPQLVVTHGTDIYWRGGPWIGNRFAGVPEVPTNIIIDTIFVSTSQLIGYYFQPVGEVITRFAANPNGTAQRFVWADPPGQWNVFWKTPKDQCDTYALCGPFGACNTEFTPVCRCLKGFRPSSPDRWALRDWSGGCVRNTTLDCSNGERSSDEFIVADGVKLPDTTEAVAIGELGLGECRQRCLTNCSCTAYSLWNLTGDGKGCIMWAGELKDVRTYSVGGQQLNLRVAAGDAGDSVSEESDSGKKRHVVAIVIPIVLASIVFFCLGLFLWRRKRKHSIDRESKRKEMDLPLFDMKTIENATKNFSNTNKIGEGGFGPVYKGQLGDGQEIAVKRLSRNSVQGLEEFMTEVVLIAKLQHRNLVRLLGCCIHGDERLLIYEYLLNKSLDSFIFDKTNSNQLLWPKRFEIIMGIARGLLYLHQDSRFKIVHRDLKVSNILLDKDMVPKISDFGMARIVRGDQMQENTEKVVGTYGYMSPEYVMHGIFSAKSDVFSFGVIVLEIITGMKNRVCNPNESQANLLAHVWKLWSEGSFLKVVDGALLGDYSESEVKKCMQLGLLCVQEGSEYRPTMASVVLMLGSEGITLPQPRKPGFYPREGSTVSDLSLSHNFSTVDDITVTVVEGR